MAEQRKVRGVPFNQPPKHGSNQRGVRAMPRTAWEASRVQADQAQFMLREQFAKKERQLQEARRTQQQSEQPDELSQLVPLPADAHEAEIIANLKEFRAFTIEGATGSGKSTRVPHMTRRDGVDLTIPMVPRKLIAEGLHGRLVDEMGAYLGEEAAQTVGLAHGDREERHDNDKVVVMTPNTFVRMEKNLHKEYGDRRVVLIADEIHEANLYTEIAFGVAALAVSRQKNWRLIAMSATNNAAALAGPFALINEGQKAPTVSIEGRPFDLEVHERPRQSVTDVYAEVGEDHERTLIFTSGKNEIKHIIKEITKRLEEEERGSSSKVEFRMLYAELNETMRKHALSRTPFGKRVVIVSTPIAMSGVTPPGVTCVITDGTINRPELDEERISGMRRRYLSKAEVIQEIGRAGRDVPGGVGYIVKPTAIFEDKAREQGKIVADEDMPYIAFDKRDEFGPPEIYNTNLGSVDLSIAANGYQFTDVNKFLPHPVEESDILKTQEGLYRIGAKQISDDGELFVNSSIGNQMDMFPVRPELTRGFVEAQRNNRSLLQLSRIALIIAAVDAGGLQEYSNDAGDNWREFLRMTTADDMMAQYDIMTALPFTHEDDIDEKFIIEHDLSYRHIERSLKVARKILKGLGVSRHNIVFTPPNQAEEDEIRRDLTAGLIDNVYRKVGYYQKRQMYRNIHGEPGATERYISDRSLVSPHEHEYVAGMPRWFIKGRNKIKHNVVELAMPVDPAVVAQYAMRNNIIERGIVDSAVVDNAVVERYQPKFGSIVVGAPEYGSQNQEIPIVSQERLVQHVLANQGPAQQALRAVAAELEQYTKRVPADTLKSLTKDDSGQFLTAEKIEQEIRNAAKKTRIVHEVDHALRLFMYQANVGIDRYFTTEAREELAKLSPSEFKINGTYVTLQYDSPELPYITMPQTQAVKDIVRRTDMRLPDGREIFVKRVGENGDVDFISATQI